jgi:hypothetical protein
MLPPPIFDDSCVQNVIDSEIKESNIDYDTLLIVESSLLCSLLAFQIRNILATDLTKFLLNAITG